MRKAVKIIFIGLVLLAGVATTATLTLSDSSNISKGVVQMACITCGNDVDDGGG